MNVDGVIHHSLEQGFLHHDLAPGVGKMGGVRPGGVHAPRPFPDHDAATLHVEILRPLDQQSHARALVQSHIIQDRLPRPVNHASRMGAVIIPQHQRIPRLDPADPV